MRENKYKLHNRERTGSIENSINANNPAKKWTRDKNRYFSKDEIQMTNRHEKKC